MHILLVLLIALEATPAFAVPMAYNYDSAGTTGVPDAEGAGMFTVDIGQDFDTYAATSVMVGPGTAPWVTEIRSSSLLRTKSYKSPFTIQLAKRSAAGSVPKIMASPRLQARAAHGTLSSPTRAKV
jgi:hypothetical protein